MFQFGILATHLPHLIIAAAYMIYFGVCAFDADLDDNLELDTNEILVVESTHSLQIHSNIAYYDVHQDVITDENQQIKWIRHRLSNKELFYHFEEPLRYRYRGSQVLSRPPPAC